MTITITPPLVPATAWNYGASVPYASFGIAQDLTVTLSPGNDSTVVAVYLSSSPVSAGSLTAPYTTPPTGTSLAGVVFNNAPTLHVSDDETRANAHILLARFVGANAATVTVTGNASGSGLNLSLPYSYKFGAITFSTSSASFVDVTGASTTITTTGSAQAYAHANVSYTGAPSLVGQVRLVIDSQASDATTLDGTNTVENVGLQWVTTGLTAGTYTVKVQALKVSGSGSVSVTHVDLFTQAQQAVG